MPDTDLEHVKLGIPRAMSQNMEGAVTAEERTAEAVLPGRSRRADSRGM